MAIGIAMSGVGARAEKLPPKELVQYIQNAKRRGMNESQIKREALASGWAASVVDKAMAYTKKGNASLSAAPSADAGAPGRTQSPAAVFEMPSGAVADRAASTQDPVAAPKDNLSKSGSVPEDYQIGAGDALQISVWKEPDVSVPSVVVRPDGMITVPLIKDVAVGGMTPRQVEKVIADGFAKYITDPNVTVVVSAINSKKVYLVGAVKNEGPLPYTYRMTVMQALSEAGGLTEYARRKKIYIIRNESGRDYRLDFDYDEVVKGERMEQNIVLMPGDTIIIPQ